MNRLKPETFWIDTLGSLKPTGLNKQMFESLVMPFSRKGNMASRIINKHVKNKEGSHPLCLKDLKT